MYRFGAGMVDPWEMARTNDSQTAPEVRALGVTVLPSFEPEPTPPPGLASPPGQSTWVTPAQRAEPAPLAAQAGAQHAQASRGARAMLRRRPGRAPLVVVPEPAVVPAPAVIQPQQETPLAAAAYGPSITAAPVATPPAPTIAPAPQTLELLTSELRQERERADAAEAANAVLRRRLAQLDDELSQFRPRAIVPFEDNTD